MNVAWTFTLVISLVIAQAFHATEGSSLKETEIIKCENGGLSDGEKCICLGNVYGSRCELVRDRVFLGTELNATILVELPVTGVEYTNELEDQSSGLYKSLEATLIKMEKEILPNYFQDIKITGFRIANPNATVIVHEVIIRIPFSNGAVTDQYAKIYKEVETKLKETEKCIDGHFTPFCVDGKAVITTLNPPPTEKELCVRNINVLFVNYFEPVVETEGLSCVSECDFSSPKYVDCNTGTCQIKQDGAQCFCPNTHKYLYTYSRCRGAVLIAGMYGGAGAAIAVLVIVAVILGVFFYRKKKY